MKPDDLRDRLRKARDQLDQASTTARALPPLWGITRSESRQPCASCGAEASSYKLVEGHRSYICGDCALKEMDDWEKFTPEQSR